MANRYTPICTALGETKTDLIKQALKERFSAEVYVTTVHIHGHIGDDDVQIEYGVRMSMTNTSYTAKEVKSWVNGFLFAKFGE